MGEIKVEVPKELEDELLKGSKLTDEIAFKKQSRVKVFSTSDLISFLPEI